MADPDDYCHLGQFWNARQVQVCCRSTTGYLGGIKALSGPLILLDNLSKYSSVPYHTFGYKNLKYVIDLKVNDPV